jgi:hypothetical protein
MMRILICSAKEFGCGHDADATPRDMLIEDVERSRTCSVLMIIMLDQPPLLCPKFETLIVAYVRLQCSKLCTFLRATGSVGKD